MESGGAHWWGVVLAGAVSNGVRDLIGQTDRLKGGCLSTLVLRFACFPLCFLVALSAPCCVYQLCTMRYTIACMLF